MKKFSKKKQEKLELLRHKQNNLYEAREREVKELGYQYNAITHQKQRIKLIEKDIEKNMKKIEKLMGNEGNAGAVAPY